MSNVYERVFKEVEKAERERLSCTPAPNKIVCKDTWKPVRVTEGFRAKVFSAAATTNTGVKTSPTVRNPTEKRTISLKLILS